ncbi:unnamed protein product [Pelagomonas calceolata]|uniref:Uncharacterized protein n=2 Tax=Pelagomonas calceolata TaxID=35677 RepID=A0A8J2WWT5_9STRA|nr:unnamed protein product [Pelagomonas calceolata]
MMGPAALLCVVSLLEAVAGSALDNGSRRRPPVATSRALVVARERRLTTADYAWVVRLAASDAASYDRFGYSVAIDGDTIVIGASGCIWSYCSSIAGSTYVYRTSDGGATWVEMAKLTASDAASNDLFGTSVAISGDTIVVGAHAKNDGTGAAYVFRTSDGWDTHTEIKLTASDAAAGDQFGISVAIDGTTVVVGASGKDSGDDCTYAYDNWSGNWEWSGDDCDHGAVYVFLTTDGGATYDQVAKLTAADAASNDKFGYSVATCTTVLCPAAALCKYGNTIVVGAPYDNIDGGNGGYQIGQGSAYVFQTSDGGSYGQVDKLTAADAAVEDTFGISVAIDDGTVVVGAFDANDYKGAAYVFHATDDLPAYSQVAMLTPSDARRSAFFGNSVAIDGDTVVVGTGEYEAAYVFRTTDYGYTYPQVDKLTASDREASFFGSSVAIDDGTVVVGAKADEHDGGDGWPSRKGSVYVLSSEPPKSRQQKDKEKEESSVAVIAGAAAAVALLLAVAAFWFYRRRKASMMDKAHELTRANPEPLKLSAPEEATTPKEEEATIPVAPEGEEASTEQLPPPPPRRWFSRAEPEPEPAAPKAEEMYNRIAAWYHEPENGALRATWGAYPDPGEFQTWPGFVAVTNAFLDREAG